MINIDARAFKFVLLESLASLLFIKVIKTSWHLISTEYQIICLTSSDQLCFTMARSNHFQNRIIQKWKSIFRSSPQEIKIKISAIKPVGIDLLQCAIGLASLCSKNRVLCLSASLLKTDYYARNYADCRYYAPDYTRRKTSPLPLPLSPCRSFLTAV